MMKKNPARYALLWLVGGMTSLSVGGCRQAPYGEAGLERALLEPARATLGLNIRGEWIWAQAKPSDEPVELVIISAHGERKLMYARQFGDRTWALYPISPTTQAWFERAAKAPQTKVVEVKATQVKALTDHIGWFDGKRVRWLGPAPGEAVVAVHWAPRLPDGERGEPARLREVLKAGGVIDEAGEVRALEEGDAAPALKPGFISVEGARSVRAAQPLRVLWAAEGEPALPSLAKRGAQISAGSSERFKSWRPEYAFSLQADAQPMLRDMVVHHREAPQEPWRVLIQDPWRAQAGVGAVGWPSLMWEPMEVNDAKEVDGLATALYSAWAGWPLTSWTQLGELKSLRAHKNDAAPEWRRWELLGAAQRSPWAVGALMEDKTRWSAPDLYTQGQVYLLEGSFDAAAASARASISAFLKWPRPARDNGIGRSERLLAQALAGTGDKAKLAQAMREAARGAAYHLAGGDSLAAAQAEREAARYAAAASLWDEAIFYASKSRSRFYHKGLASLCAQVELELAMIHASAGQRLQAKRYVGYASQRFKALNDPIGLNRAQLVATSLSQQEDITLSLVTRFEQALTAAKQLVDPYAELMATVELALYRPFESQQALKRLLTSLTSHLAASRLSLWEQRVWDATALVCAYERPAPELTSLQATREREACARADEQVVFDRELVQRWLARAFARMQLERDAKPLLVALDAGLSAQDAAQAPLPEAARVMPVQRLMLTLLAQLVEPNRADAQSISAVNETLKAHSDPLLYAELLVLASVELEERGQERLALLMFERARAAAAAHRQRELWAQATLGLFLLQDRVAGAIEPAQLVSARQEASRLGVEPSFSLKLDAFKRYSAGLGDERSARFGDGEALVASLGSLIFEERLAVLLLAAKLAQRHGQWDAAQAHLVELRRLEAGAPPAFVRSSLGRQRRGESLVLQARQGWQRGEYDEVAKVAKLAHEVLVEEPDLNAQRLRAEALMWWALVSTSAQEDARIDRELTLMTSLDPSAARHSWRQVMGQRARALIAFDRGQLQESAQALEWLSLQGYALEDAQAFGRGCAKAQLKLVQELEDDPQTSALQWLRFCGSANPPQRIKEHIAVLSAISEGALDAWLKVNASAGSSDDLSSQEHSTRVALIARWMRPERAPSPRRQLELTTELDRAKQLGGATEQLEAGLKLADELLITGQLDGARDLLVALKPLLTSTSTPTPPELTYDYLATRHRYYMMRGRPQDMRTEAAALPTLSEAQQAQASVNAALGRLMFVSAKQALILGQRQLTRQRLMAALKAAKQASSPELIAQINQLAATSHLSIASPPELKPAAAPLKPK